jgi:hypothetical protein
MLGYQSGRMIGNKFGLGTERPTAVEQRETMKGITPRFNWFDRAGEMTGLGSTNLNWADQERLATPPGAPYQDTSGNAGPVTRTEADWNARKMGTYTLKETTEKTSKYIADKEKKERSERFSATIKRMVDDMVMHPNDPKSLERMEPFLEKLNKEEIPFTGQQIKTAIKARLLNQLLESDEPHSATPSREQIYMQQLLRSLR